MEGEGKIWEKHFDKALFKMIKRHLKSQIISILKLNPLTLPFKIMVWFCLINGPRQREKR